ncbi:hypothetical protein DSO57_1000539 [Entomophthora muscae]|uniref:Uncharacterized protein n=1 Tax=Entomophthora muscae TaxID=34485 RepID=A0ACC2RP78_9FUNG|nr:hypothetical protein DSO57_1000539 [Entomophthora muscae]
MRELKKLLKDLDLAIAKIKDINCKVKAKVKSAVLTEDKINKVSAKSLMSKMPDTPEKTIKHLLNIQKTVVEGLQFKAYNPSVLSVWVDDLEMYEHLKPAKHAREGDTELPAQLIAPRMAKPAEAVGKEEIQEGSLKNKINLFSKNLTFFLENVDSKLRQVLVPFVLATFYENHATHVAKQLYLSPLLCRSWRTVSTGPFQCCGRSWQNLHMPSGAARGGPGGVTVGSIMPGIVRPSKKAQKAGKPVSKLTKLTDWNQMVDQKWVTAAPVCQLKPAPPFKLMLIN